MHVIDFTRDERFLLRSDLFEHYFLYWGTPNTREIPFYEQDRIHHARKIVTSRLPAIERAFVNAALSLDQIDLVLMVGQGTSNGHAILADDRAIVWIPLEAYASERQVDVFLTHEIAHGLHYLSCPEFFFHSGKEKNHIGRQTMTEGIATFVTKQVTRLSSEDVLWADFLSPNERKVWMDLCAREQEKLRAFVHAHWNDTYGSALDLFFVCDSSDIYRYRAGYFVAWKLIEAVVAEQSLSLQDLLTTPRALLETWSDTYIRG